MKKNVMSNKEFRTNGVTLSIQVRIKFLYEKRLIDEAIKFLLALSRLMFKIGFL